MNWLNPIYIVPLGVLSGAVAVILMIAARRAIRASTRARRRQVEPPNSHFTSQKVRDGEALTRWRDVSLNDIHEINRGLVQQLLARAEASGVQSLSPAERVFLDQFSGSAQAADTPAQPSAPPATRTAASDRPAPERS